MRLSEKIVEACLLICALSSVLTIALIIFFIIGTGLPILTEQGLWNFIFGTRWYPQAVGGIYGVLPFIVGTLEVTILSLILGLPLSLGCAILLAEIAPGRVRNILKPAIETLAGIPSVVYGFFGLVVIVPFIMGHFGGAGTSVLACGIVLAIMIMPTIISVSEDSLRAVPQEYREGALAMGATKWQTITGIVVPTAMSGIVTSAVLAMGRSIGETMAVLMVGGSVGIIPTSLLSGVEPLTAVIALEWGYASGDHRAALFAVGIVLLAITMTLNAIVYMANKNKTVERA